MPPRTALLSGSASLRCIYIGQGTNQAAWGAWSAARNWPHDVGCRPRYEEKEGAPCPSSCARWRAALHCSYTVRVFNIPGASENVSHAAWEEALSSRGWSSTAQCCMHCRLKLAPHCVIRPLVAGAALHSAGAADVLLHCSCIAECPLRCVVPCYTQIDPWWLEQHRELHEIGVWLRTKTFADLDAQDMQQLKRRGFSDAQLARLLARSNPAGQGRLWGLLACWLASSIDLYLLA
eukprot:1155797-Pelagomonas_calceolata.AAC.8